MIEKHDHNILNHDSLLEMAEAVCAERNVRLTRQRKLILAHMPKNGQSITAYQLLDKISHILPNAKPATIYRALDFLVAQGLVHRLASLNSFIACSHPCTKHQCQFLICKACGSVEEIEDPLISSSIGSAIRSQGFVAEQSIVEIPGKCVRCQH